MCIPELGLNMCTSAGGMPPAPKHSQALASAVPQDKTCVPGGSGGTTGIKDVFQCRGHALCMKAQLSISECCALR